MKIHVLKGKIVRTKRKNENVILEPFEIMQLPLKERRRILEKAATKAEDEYLSNPELTAFEAFGHDDFCDETV